MASITILLLAVGFIGLVALSNHLAVIVTFSAHRFNSGRIVHIPASNYFTAGENPPGTKSQLANKEL
jgi:hypothetical protein